MQRRKRLLRFGLLATSIVVALAFGWPTMSWMRKKLKPVRMAAYGLQLVDDADRPLGIPRGKLKLVLDPFTVYRIAPNQATKAFTINSLGGRGKLPTGKGPCVVVLGSSAAFGQELSSDSESFAAVWQNASPGTRIYNFAAPGYLAGQELSLCVHHLRDVPANLVIAFDGWNETFDIVQGAPRRDGYYGFNCQFFEVRDRLAAMHAGGTAPSLPPPDVGPEERKDKTIANYFANILDLARIVKARGGKFLWVIQPELGSRAHQTTAEKDILATWERNYRYSPRKLTEVYSAMQTQAKEFAREQGINLVVIDDDAAWRRAEGTLFADPVHPNATGHLIIAGILKERASRLLQADGYRDRMTN